MNHIRGHVPEILFPRHGIAPRIHIVHRRRLSGTSKGSRRRYVLYLASALTAITLITYFFLSWIGIMGEGRFVAWASDPLVKIFKDTRPPSNYTQSVVIEAVRNEYAAAQFAVTAESGTPEVHLRITPLEGPEGSLLNFSVNFVGFVPVKKNTPDTPSAELVRTAPFDAPDPLLGDSAIRIKNDETQPVWITIFIPADAPAGNYTGNVDVLSEAMNASISIALHVYPVTLPTERHLWLTNWFNAMGVAERYRITSWSDEHWHLIAKYARIMAEHRQTVIITPIFELIRFIKGPDGSLGCDFTNFDRWVELFRREGVIGRIEGSHLAGRSEWEATDFDSQAVTVYYPNGSVAYKQPSMKTTSVEYRNFLSRFLPQLERHLLEKGWLGSYVQHLADEPIAANEASYRVLAGYVKEFAPNLKRIDANQDMGLIDALDIWVPILHEFDANQSFYAQRRATGEETWFYTCLAPTGRYPNRFIDYPLVKVRILHWINYKYNLSGYLHWGLNYWSDDPFQDVEPTNLPPGDAFIIYPGKDGPLSSIRFETLRLGVQDYELLRMLEEVDPQRARQLAESVVRSLTDYEEDALRFYQARRNLMTALIPPT
jgi:hypothetical protein